MNVAKLFASLAVRPNVKVVKPCLPESVRNHWGAPGLAAFARPFDPLRTGSGNGSFPGASIDFRTPDKTQLQGLDGTRERRPLRFTHQQRHDDISQDHEPIAAAHPF